MVVAVDAIRRLDTHAEEPGSAPHADVVLHQPGRRRVAEGMWRDLAGELRQSHCGLERGLYRRDGRPIPLHEVLLDVVPGLPAPQVRQ